MKIENQLSVPLGQNLSAQHQSSPDFENWLCNSAKRNTGGDDYYWQHQDQLQQSALTFKFRMALSQDDDHNNHSLLASAEKTELNDSVITSNHPYSCSQESYLSFDSKTIVVDQLTRDIVQCLSQQKDCLPTENTQANRQPNQQKMPAVSAECLQPALTKMLAFKNHQIFIQGNQIELTLNTANLSKQEVQDLKKMLKKWMTNQGLVLKQLIINGIQQ